MKMVDLSLSQYLGLKWSKESGGLVGGDLVKGDLCRRWSVAG